MAASAAAISAAGSAILRDQPSPPHARSPPPQLTEWIDTEIAASFGDRVLPLSSDVLMASIGLSRHLRIRRRTGDAADLLIAATARVHDLVIVSRNARDFAGTGVVVYDPWTSKTPRMEQA